MEVAAPKNKVNIIKSGERTVAAECPVPQCNENPTFKNQNTTILDFECICGYRKAMPLYSNLLSSP